VKFNHVQQGMAALPQAPSARASCAVGSTRIATCCDEHLDSACIQDDVEFDRRARGGPATSRSSYSNSRHGSGLTHRRRFASCSIDTATWRGRYVLADPDGRVDATGPVASLQPALLSRILESTQGALFGTSRTISV
jgi:hypothetical protein